MDDCTLQRIKCSAEERARATGEQSDRPVSFRLAGVLSERAFRLLWAGEFISLLGDQFFVVALPWLVLQLTGDALAIGTVLAVGAAPRTVFMLVGGALTDRFSPRAVMLYSNIGRMALVAALALLTATGSIQLWMLYVFNLLLGLGYAFYLPAQSAIIPRLVPQRLLQTGNALIQGTAQLSLFLGPVIAGLLIALLGRGGSGGRAPGDLGIGIVFAVDAASFLASAVTLTMLSSARGLGLAGETAVRVGVFESVAAGVTDVWRDKTLRYYFLMIGVVNLALLGPLSVGIPILARTRFEGGALAYGAVLSGLGAGALAGVALGGTLRRPSGRRFAAALLGCAALLGVGLALLGAVASAAVAVAAGFVIGTAEGYLTIQFITWLQLRTSRERLGRMMSILLFVSVGQAPLSNLIAGALIGSHPAAVMMGAGGLIVLVSVVAALSPSVWRLGESAS